MPFLSLVFLTACIFPFGVADEADKPAEDTASTERGAGACDDYLACLAEVEPGTFGELIDTYGADGSCWSNEATADDCAEVCEEQLAQLQEEFPKEVACGYEEPNPADFPFDEGDWQIQYVEFEARTCSYFDDDFLAVLNSSAEASFKLMYGDFPSFEMYLGGGAADCTLDGQEFLCDLSRGDVSLVHEGSFLNRNSGSGQLLLDDGEGCTGTITFEMSL